MRYLRTLAAAACAAVLAACTNDVTLTNPVTGLPPNFIQIEAQGRNLTINLFSPWANHKTINYSNIGPAGTIISSDIGTFMTQTAGRSTAITAQVQTLLTPNVLIADLSQSGNASYLGVETGGKLNLNGTVCGSGAPNASPCTGGLFGGRGLNDDLGASMLGLAFGPQIPQLFPTIPDDGKEQDGTNGTANLANDNVPSPANFAGTFPYLAAPH